MKPIFPFFISFLFVLSHSVPLNAQKWAVYFKDKNNSAYSIDKPEEFLSQRSIDRRAKYHIEITEEDLPVNENYVKQIKQLGVDIIGTSKWFNCALINTHSQDIIVEIKQMEFVDKAVNITPHNEENSYLGEDYYKWNNPIYKSIKSNPLLTDAKYGSSFHQINQVNGIPLHKRGFTGQGILITILDSGFENTNQLDVFAHIRERNGIVFERDLVNPGGNIYFRPHYPFDHGTNVFSCLGSKLEGRFIGTAPDADYALIRMNDSGSPEYFLVAEYNWAIGAELADSLGSDIINSSQGFLHYPYSDRDGRKPTSSYAAYRAVEKGIFVCTAAGNNQYIPSNPWIASPADTPEVATIGAVYQDGRITNFSAIGPNTTGFPKPDMVALGADVTIALPSNEIVTDGGGTSFSTPIVCGMVACLIQAFPLIPPLELKAMINRTGNYSNNHQIDYGYGIPDFDKVYTSYTGISPIKTSSIIRSYPNPVKDNLYIESKEIISRIEIIELSGKAYRQINSNSANAILDMSSYSKGIWLLNIEFRTGAKEVVKIVKL